MNKQQIYDVIRIVADAIVAIAAILCVQSCVVTRNTVRRSQGVTISNETKSQQSADSASINLKDFAK
uniref:Uncharacterized protein n=1 Tax=Microviridae sp. ctbkO13 TaxID=2825003 RepID=A0A8S5R375_9VIRU|nr:MAG TPA: hypothetical protein [Microviridae sp. ctbkO13]